MNNHWHQITPSLKKYGMLGGKNVSTGKIAPFEGNSTIDIFLGEKSLVLECKKVPVGNIIIG